MTHRTGYVATPNLPERLQTFHGFWDDHEATARQLAVIGHVYDRPPLEALEEGSRCIECSAFVRRESSIRALEGPISSSQSYAEGFETFNFHKPGCDWLQVRVPLEPQAVLGGLYGFRMDEMRSRFERRSAGSDRSLPRHEQLQTSSLFSLPAEIRLEIYAMVLPTLDTVQSIEPLNQDSSRVITAYRHARPGPRDMSKANLLRTCRAVHNEALDVLFTNITFSFSSTKIMYLFLRQIGKRGRDLLKAVDIRCGSREDAISFALLASCPNSRAITIRLARPMLLIPRPPQWWTEGVASLLTLSGMENVRFADCGPDIKYTLSDIRPDAAIVRRELTRPKGTAGSVRWVDGYLDI